MLINQHKGAYSPPKKGINEKLHYHCYTLQKHAINLACFCNVLVVRFKSLSTKMTIIT